MATSRRPAFSLIELVVVISVVMLLLALTLPVLTRAKEQARRIVCLNHQRQINTGVSSYATDHDGRYLFNHSAAAFAVTSRSGWVGWADARPRFDTYVADPTAFYCPSGAESLTCPTSQNFGSFTINVGGQGWHKLAGYRAIPNDVPADYYVHIDYTIFPGFVRKSNSRLITYLFEPEQTVSDLPGYGWDRPTIPDRMGVTGGLEPAKVPMTADVAYAQDPNSLVALVNGEFVLWDDPYVSAGNRTIMKAHLGAARQFEGLAASFLDGHAVWRDPDVTGPRTALFTNGANYNYVTWY